LKLLSFFSKKIFPKSRFSSISLSIFQLTQYVVFSIAILKKILDFESFIIPVSILFYIDLLDKPQNKNENFLKKSFLSLDSETVIYYNLDR